MITLSAWGPLAPWVTLNSTRWPSSKLAITIGEDGAVVDENIVSTFSLNESKTLGGIEPLNCALNFIRH